MPKADDIRWFKQQFQEEIEGALEGTPFDVDMMAAIACQETGHIWSILRKKPLTNAQILARCVGDTLDADKGRKAFPKTKSELLAAPNGADMFAVGRQALEEMAQLVPGFGFVSSKPNKFPRGYGMFQLDLQFFKVDPDYFLQRRYEIFSETLGKCLAELRSALKKVGFQSKTSLTDFEFACVAIAYNTGGFKPSKVLQQGHFNGTRFYGEEVFDFVRLSRTVAKPGESPQIAAPPAGRAIIPPVSIPRQSRGL